MGLIERRSLRLRTDCRDQALLTYRRSMYQNQEQLAIAVGSSQPVVSQFFTHKPVETATFIKLCDKLKLTWEEMADSNVAEPEPTNSQPIPKKGSEPEACEEHPWGELPIVSRFYIERSPTEPDCYAAIRKANTLIRIKAARQMGKSSLLSRILDQASRQGDRVVRISLESMDERFLADYDIFLHWFCRIITHKLNLPDTLAQYWASVDLLGSNECFKDYLERGLLPQLQTPLTLGLDEVDRIFEYPSISQAFFPLLREIHEKGKHTEIWKRLRLVLVHFNEIHLPNIHQSPFNVGLSIELKGFTLDQAQALAQRYPLQINPSDLQDLMAIVGGNPFLLRQAMEILYRHDQPFAQVLAQATTNQGIYSGHLRHLELILTQYPPLLSIMQQIAIASEPSTLKDSSIRDKLQAIGLIKLEGNGVLPSCELYRQYFQSL
jgi:hypothetical protein